MCVCINVCAYVCVYVCMSHGSRITNSYINYKEGRMGFVSATYFGKQNISPTHIKHKKPL